MGRFEVDWGMRNEREQEQNMAPAEAFKRQEEFTAGGRRLFSAKVLDVRSVLLECLDGEPPAASAGNVAAMFADMEHDLGATTVIGNALAEVLLKSGLTLEQYCAVSQLPLKAQVVMAIGLSFSGYTELENQAMRFVVSTFVRDEGAAVMDDALPDHIYFDMALCVRRCESMNESEKRGVLDGIRNAYPKATLPPLLWPGLRESEESDPGYDCSPVPDVGSLIAGTLSVVDILMELGYGITATISSFEEFISLFPNIGLDEVAAMIATMACTAEVHSAGTHQVPVMEVLSNVVSQTCIEVAATDEQPGYAGWNIDSIVTVLSKKLVEIGASWDELYSFLDCKHFTAANRQSLDFLSSVYSSATRSMLPVRLFLTEWKHQDIQLQLLAAAVSAPPQAVDFNTRTRSQRVIRGLQPESCQSVADGSRNCWLCLDLVDTLLRISQSSLRDAVRELIYSTALDTHPEYLVLAVAQSPFFSTFLGQELMGEMLPLYLTGHANSSLVLPRLWKLKPCIFTEWMVRLYQDDRAFVERALDIAQNLNDALTVILEARPFRFTINLAVVAARREFINLGKWLELRLVEHGDAFARACLDFIEHQTGAASVIENSPALLSAFRFSLESNEQLFESDTMKRIQDIFPQIGQSAVEEQQQPVPQQLTSIEEEANAYFQKIYDENLTIPEAVSTLRQFKVSGDDHENNVYTAMIMQLFDEYRFFSQYPERELRITGVLFGTLIRDELVVDQNLNTALKLVLEALQKGPADKMHQFGIWALEEFKENLPQWPSYCARLVEVQSLRSRTDLIESLNGILSVANPSADAGPAAPTAVDAPYDPPVATSAAVVSRPREVKPNAPRPGLLAASSGSIDEALTQRGYRTWDETSPDLADKLAFIVNNVDVQNLRNKGDELRELLTNTPEAIAPFAHYLVVKRVTVESNFLKTYDALIERVDLLGLEKVLLEYTYASANVLLESSTIVQSSQERSLLKNLGTWLGMLTIKRDRPPRAGKINFKKLIVDAFDRGRLIAVIPFVAKVLFLCPSSTVFRPPNPWLMMILSLLAEIYNVAELKMNLKFEIEVLFKNTGIIVKDVVIRNFVSHVAINDSNENFRQRADDSNTSASPAIAASSIINAASAEFTAPSRAFIPVHPDGLATIQAQSSPQDHARLSQAHIHHMAAVDEHPSSTSVTINPSLILLQRDPRLQSFAASSIDQAISDIITPVVERSVHIACITTKELVVKDFALDPDPLRMRRAAHEMVRTLTGSLSLVTCKDPLRSSMASHLTAVLQQYCQDKTLIDETVQRLIDDNLEFGCSVVEKTACERAIRQIDDQLRVNFDVRAQSRERGQTYYDMSYMIPMVVPDLLRPNTNRNHQLRVYDDFALVRLLSAEATVAAVAGARNNSGEIGANPTAPAVRAHEQLTVLLSQLEQLTNHADGGKHPGIDQQIHQLLGNLQISVKTLSSTDSDSVRMFVQRVLAEYLGFNLKPTFADLYLAVIKVMCHALPQLSPEVAIYVAHVADERPLNLPAAFGLLRENVIHSTELDASFTRLLASGPAQHSVDSIIKLIRASIKELRIAPVDFCHSLDVLVRLPRLPKVLEDQVGALLAEVRDVNMHGSVSHQQQQPQPQVIDLSSSSAADVQMKAIFQDWMDICINRVGAGDEMSINHLRILRDNGILKSDATAENYLRVLAVSSVESCHNDSGSNDDEGGLIYTSVDGLAKLVVFLVKSVGPHQAGIGVSKTSILATFLSLVTDLVTRDSQRLKKSFNQRPYFRIFITLVQELNGTDPELDSVSIPILLAFGSTFHALQPQRVPSFGLAWLELVCHRMFMPRVLQTKSAECLDMFHLLLVDLFQFMHPYLKHSHLTDSVRLMYKGTLRVLLILLHDFPEFLCSFHFSFCDVIPASCIQLRNLILSAFPRNMRLPDPFLPDLKVDSLPDIKVSPTILSNTEGALIYSGIKTDIDRFFELDGGDKDFLSTLHPKLNLRQHEIYAAGTAFNIPLINSLVLYVGTKGITNLNVATSTENNPAMDIFSELVTRLPDEGRHYFLNAIANQLRYPNNHTHYFSCVMLYLFVDARSEDIQEQITRVLLERLIVHRPHPWGLLITFIELIKNPLYDFWSHQFTRFAPEIEKLFESVARSCMQNPPPSPSQVPGSGAEDDERARASPVS